MGDRDLTTPEGVDDASATGTAEGLDVREQGGPQASAASPGPRSAQVPEQPTTVEGGGDDLLGEAPRGAPVDEAQAAGPVDMESDESRAARAEQGPGQQYQTGEG